MDCRIDQQAFLVHRILMEFDTSDGNVGFLTCTYDEKNQPEGGSLRRRDSDLFLKRYREVISREWPGRKIRYVRVGEYGKGGRPHYHYVLFGIRCEYGVRTRTKHGGWQCECRPCQLARQTWPLGFVKLEEFGQDAARYIAKYCLKRLTDPKDPRLKGRDPEFGTRSTRPGLGRVALDQVAKDTLAMWAESPNRRFHDVPRALQRGRKKMPLDQYCVRKLREACGRDPGSPPEVRAAALARDADAYEAALFTRSNGRGAFNSTTFKKRLIRNRTQAAVNKKARNEFGARTRWSNK